MAEKKPQARSPYQRYGKREYKYSPAFMRWHNAAIRGDDSAMIEADREWRNLFNIPQKKYA